ncbi:MAG TPA: hypothetical protein VGI39_04860 [Polyangiaceae bacterium]|jgi:hypothetical protein
MSPGDELLRLVIGGFVLWSLIWAFTRMATEVNALRRRIGALESPRDEEDDVGPVCARCGCDLCALCGAELEKNVPPIELDGFLVCAEHFAGDDGDEDEVEEGDVEARPVVQ